jgi:acyl-CoA synthetase (AMP-forming)/AMP-acid ligase II
MALLKPWTEAITMGDALLRSADARPEHKAIAMPAGSWTYGELAERALRVARNLIGLGIAPGEHVGVLMPNGFDILATYFGVSLAGCAIVPINARFRTRELGYIVSNADLACVITNDANDAYVNYLDLLIESIEARGGAPLLRSTVVLGEREREGVLGDADFDALGEDVSDQQVHLRRHGVSVADPAMILYTSGTTADPRGAIISHESIVRVWAGAVSHAMRLGPDDRMWNPCPMFHIAAMGVSVACVTHGMTIVTAPFFEPDSAIDLLERERPTALYPAYANILLGVLTHPRFSEVELVASSALVVGAPSTLRALQEQLPGCTVVTTFGMTESCGCATYTDIDDTLELRSETVGPPIAGLELRIADPLTDEPLGADARGEIQLRGPILFDGYYKDPEKTAATFLEGGWMRTGDLGSMTADGRARYLGRLKDIIRVGGENLSPAEIEAHLMTHPSVLIAQAVGIPDPRLEEVPVAFVELRAGAEASEEELIAYCEGAIARFKVPRHVRFVDEWPMSATKVQKFRLREQILAELKGVRPL